MNGDTVYKSHLDKSDTNSNQSIKLSTDGRCSPLSSQQNEDQREIYRPFINSNQVNESKSQCSPCWTDEQTSDQHHCSSRASAKNSLQVGNDQRRRGSRNKQFKVTDRKRTVNGIAAQRNSQNRKVTDYYPIRRSSRRSKTDLKCEQKKLIDELITKGIEDGMEVHEIAGKGRAVFATRRFQKGEYVVEYHGDLLQITDAKKREAEYAQNPATGCYMYYFQYLCKTYCVDATKETHRLGRLINHSKNGNCQTKLHDINGVPHLILIASRNIEEGEELLYDYGDRSKASIAAHPWLKY